MSRTTKPVSGFYSDEAVRIVSEAARAPQKHIEAANAEPPVSLPRTALIAPDVLLDEPQRPPLAPERAINQNDTVPRPIPVGPEPRNLGFGRVVAWILLAPWYAAILIGSVGIDAMFVKDLFGL